MICIPEMQVCFCTMFLQVRFSVWVNVAVREYPTSRKYGTLTFILSYLNQSHHTTSLCTFNERHCIFEANQDSRNMLHETKHCPSSYDLLQLVCLNVSLRTEVHPIT